MDQIRENQITADNLFDFVTIEWKDCPDEFDANDSLNSSRISLNLSAMKEAILGNVPEQAIKTFRNLFGSPLNANKNESLLKSAIMRDSTSTQKSSNSPKRTLTCNDKESVSSKSRKSPSNMKTGGSKSVQSSPASVVDCKFMQQTEAYLYDLRKTTNKLKKLCYNHTNENQEDGINPTVTNVLRSAEQIDHIMHDIRTLLNDDANTAKTPKTVRFLID